MADTVEQVLKQKKESRWNEDKRLELMAALKKASQTKSQNDLAKMAGVNAGVLSFVANGQWEQLSDSMIAKLRSFFQLNNWNLRQSYNLVAIRSLCSDAQLNAKFLAVASYTGAGKTVALKNYNSNNQHSHYVLGTAVMTRKGFVDAILRAMAIKDEGNLEYKVGLIVGKLSRSVNPLLIIDDCGKLSDPCLQVLQIIYDSTEGHAGIVIAGMDLLKKRIDKNAARDKMGFRELKRRITYWLPLILPEQNFIQTVCNEYDITNGKALKWIEKQAVDFGTLKNLMLNIELARANNADVSVTVEFLMGLHLGDGAYMGG